MTTDDCWKKSIEQRLTAQDERIKRLAEDLRTVNEGLDWYRRREETNVAELTEIIGELERLNDPLRFRPERGMKLFRLIERLVNMRDNLAD